jgi:tetratricopeptide (TPR) repeat protein
LAAMAKANRSTRRGEPGKPVPPAATLPAAARIRSWPRVDRRLLPLALILVLAVSAVYGQTFRHEFITYDDDMYILNNPEVTGGLTWKGFRWAFGFHAANWHPLTWLSHMLDSQLFGLWAGGHHLVSVGFHAANAVVLMAVLSALTGALWRSAAVAALFALHPLRVESVVWAAERKDVLSALFWLLTMAAYLRHVRRPGMRRYLLALGLFAVGLTAKPMLVTLPFTLLLLDWWPLGRTLRHGESAPLRAVLADTRTLRALLAEKWPFFALSLLSSLVTLRGQTLNVIPFVTPDFATRLANAVTSYVRYLGAFAWPDGLAFLYPYPRAGIPWVTAAAAAAGLLLLSAAAVFFGKRRPYLSFGWFWYLGTLVPVIGLMQVGGQARSDRYTYLTMLGVAVALTWLAGDLCSRRRGARLALSTAFAVLLAAFAVSSAQYAKVWRDSVTLYEHTVRVTKDNFIVLNNLGSMLMSSGRNERAIAVLKETERINPEHCNAPYNLGVTLIRAVRNREALEALTRALACYQREGRSGTYIADTHYFLGVALSNLGRYPEAEAHLRSCLQIAPDYPGARLALGKALTRQGKGIPGHP